ncbi:hypothetical protein OESDEN_23370 [Oesophagostomum dentatum]|uniref:Uncharacterized protein n=1 Tax=Oesophagostomum dentatum TaxID=61180 RepID=A0A0B1S1A2_OESDE|nr:hypothetical protein OESDEN_23370 [Oesophagostomum dentatum]
MQVTRIEAWKCGIGPVSGAISYIIALPSDVLGVDKCCIEHDALVDGFHLNREDADQIFCQCLASSDSWYVRNVVKPLFCTSVVLYTKWFDHGKAIRAVNRTMEHRPQELVEPASLQNFERL